MGVFLAEPLMSAHGTYVRSIPAPPSEVLELTIHEADCPGHSFQHIEACSDDHAHDGGELHVRRRLVGLHDRSNP